MTEDVERQRPQLLPGMTDHSMKIVDIVIEATDRCSPSRAVAVAAVIDCVDRKPIAGERLDHMSVASDMLRVAMSEDGSGADRARGAGDRLETGAVAGEKVETDRFNRLGQGVCQLCDRR